MTCSDDHCTSIILTCATPAENSGWFLSGSVSYSESFSGAAGGAMGTCGHAVVIGLECGRGSDGCEEMRLVCRRVAVAAADEVERRGTFDFALWDGSWTADISSLGAVEVITQLDFSDDHVLAQHHPIQKVKCSVRRCDDLTFLVAKALWHIRRILRFERFKYHLDY